MRELRRVLRDDGVCWFNIGDSYATGAGKVGQWPRGYRGGRPESPIAKDGAIGPMTQPNRMPLPGLKPKDLIGMPFRLFLAFQADGWWTRCDVVWSKPNPMPESVADRPTRAHEYLFLLAKSERYFYDADAIREPYSEGTFRRVLQETFDEQEGGPKDYAATGIDPNRSARRGLENIAPKVRRAARGTPGDGPRRTDRSGVHSQTGVGGQSPHRGLHRAWTADSTPSGQLTLGGGDMPAPPPVGYRPEYADRTFKHDEHNRFGKRSGNRAFGDLDSMRKIEALGRNKRSVWAIPTQPYPEAHFATFPPALVLPCVLAGTSERGACPECGKPWVRMTLTAGGTTGADWNIHGRGDADLLIGHTVRAQAGDGTYRRWEVGWRPGCTCGAPPELGRRADDLELVSSPETAGGGDDDPTLSVGRAGFERPRDPDEAVRPITRHEQRKYAAQLRGSPRRAEMREEAGAEAFRHYLRSDRTGARPIPPDLLDAWIGRGWLEPVEVPAWDAPDPVPCVVLDPFAGSGTVALVAAKNGRESVMIELKPEYVWDHIVARLAPLEADLVNPVRVEVSEAAGPEPAPADG